MLGEGRSREFQPITVEGVQGEQYEGKPIPLGATQHTANSGNHRGI